MRCSGIILMLPSMAILIIQVCSNEHTTIEVSTNGQEYLLKCSHYKGNGLDMYWRKLSLDMDKSFNDIYDGKEVLGHLNKTYEIIANSNDLKIKQTTENESGVYKCPSNKIYLVVIDNNVTCNETSTNTSNKVFHEINCSFSFKADESCHITPLWSDEVAKKNITKSEMNLKSGYDDGYLWLRFDGNSDLRYVSTLRVGVIYNCPKASAYYNISIFNRERSFYFEGTKLSGLIPVIVICCIFLILVLSIAIFGIKKKAKNNSTDQSVNRTRHFVDIIDEPALAI